MLLNTLKEDVPKELTQLSPRKRKHAKTKNKTEEFQIIDTPKHSTIVGNTIRNSPINTSPTKTAYSFGKSHRFNKSHSQTDILFQNKKSTLKPQTAMVGNGKRSDPTLQSRFHIPSTTYTLPSQFEKSSAISTALNKKFEFGHNRNINDNRYQEHLIKYKKDLTMPGPKYKQDIKHTVPATLEQSMRPKTALFEAGYKMRELVPEPGQQKTFYDNMEGKNKLINSKQRSPGNQNWSPKSSIKGLFEVQRLKSESQKPGPKYNVTVDKNGCDLWGCKYRNICCHENRDGLNQQWKKSIPIGNPGPGKYDKISTAFGIYGENCDKLVSTTSLNTSKFINIDDKIIMFEKFARNNTIM